MRNLDWTVTCVVAVVERFQQEPSFLAAPAAQFSNDNRRREMRNNFPGVLPQDPLVRARQTIFGQRTDYLKERRAHLIVQVLGGQFLLGLGQSAADFGSEFEYRIGSDSLA